ncbi:M81 family metallopeptidase [Pelagibacteraceae bacterium]|nr:M81 family metallopeptidase [Pelagibacteraceae bacterium]
MTKKIFLSGIYHETHTFLSQPTTLDDFLINIGDEIIKKNIDNGSPTDGFIEFASKKNWDIIPGIQMAARPSGIVDLDTENFFDKNFFEKLEQHYENIDAIFLILHGAMVSKNHDDFEGDLLEKINHFLKNKKLSIPIMAVLDLHANVSDKMIDNSTCVYAYRKNPHSDSRDAAIKAALILSDIFTNPNVNQINYKTKYILPPTGVGTANDPMKSILYEANKIEKNDKDIICINVMAGYSYADIADCGFSLNCCTKGDINVAKNYLATLANILKSKIDFAYPKENTLEEALEKIKSLPKQDKPILLIEPADNIGGGTPGDATDLLSRLLQSNHEGIVAIINDPAAVKECYQHQVGEEIDLNIGAKFDDFHGSPIKLKVTIQKLSDGKFTLENKQSHLASMMGMNIDMGLSAVIKNKQLTLLLTSIKTPPMDLGQLISQDIYPAKAKFIVVKAAVSHKDAYDPIASYSFYIDSQGLCTSNLKRLPFKKIGNKIIALN